MKWVFWASVAVIAYTHLGYAAWLWLRSRWRFQPVKSGPCEPSVSIVMVVRNEAQVLESKLQNLLTLNYPAEQCEIVVVSDGSTDGTNEILSQYARHESIRVILNQESRGKEGRMVDASKLALGWMLGC